MSGSAPLSLPDVPDVLYAIFSYLDPVHHFQHEHDQVYESRRSLALAARTCRGFAGPALDVLWKRLPDDQPLADLLCEVGIATKQEDEKDLPLLGENKPGRYRLPNQGGGGYRVPGAAEAYERKWRLSRGYDIQYVRVVIPFHAGYPNEDRLSALSPRYRRPSDTPWLASLCRVRLTRPRYHIVRIRWPSMVWDLGGDAVSYGERSDPPESSIGCLLQQVLGGSHPRGARTHFSIRVPPQLQSRGRVRVAGAR